MVTQRDINGGRYMGIILKITLPFLISGTFGALGWVYSTSSTVEKLQHAVEVMKVEGTDVCKAHDRTDIQMQGEVQHIRSDLNEMKGDVKSVQQQLIESQLLQREILTTLKAMKEQ
jgi:hypothetical protein